MRLKTLSIGIGGALATAVPALAHHGDQPTHLLVDHGLGLGLLGLATLAAITVFILKRKG